MRHMCDMDPCSVADSLQISTSPTTSEEDGSTDSNRGAQATTSPYRYAKMCDITAMSVSPTADYAHFARVQSLRVYREPGHKVEPRDRTRQALPTQARRLCFGVVGRAAVRRRAVRSKFKRGGGPRFAFVVPIDCGPSGVGGRRMGNRNGARLVSPEWDEGVWFRSADVAHISLSSAVR